VPSTASTTSLSGIHRNRYEIGWPTLRSASSTYGALASPTAVRITRTSGSRAAACERKSSTNNRVRYKWSSSYLEMTKTLSDCTRQANTDADTSFGRSQMT
jgi:hypothetical protein